MESLKVGKLESWRSKMPSFETILEAYDKVIIKNMWPRSDEERRRGRRQRAAFRARLVKMYRETLEDKRMFEDLWKDYP